MKQAGLFAEWEDPDTADISLKHMQRLARRFGERTRVRVCAGAPCACDDPRCMLLAVRCARGCRSRL